MNHSTLTKPGLYNSRHHPKPENPLARRDAFNRPLHDLRISVIDRCNFRCTYCMPQDEYHPNYTFLKETQWLNFTEIARLTKLFISLGVSKVRITGGEPLLRPNLPELIAMINALPGLEDLALTTNGVYLARDAAALRRAGLKRLTVSLDTLDDTIFKMMNGNRGNVRQVLEGIEEARQQGFEKIKINAVVQKGINDGTILDLVEYFKRTGEIVRFIEYMDVGTCNNWRSELVVPSAEILRQIHKKFPVEPVAPHYHGEVADRYRFADGQGEIGFISSVTQPFCGTCTRARLSTDGKFYTCLFAGEGRDLQTPLREGKTDTDIREILSDIWMKRRDRYSQERAGMPIFDAKRKKVEMYQIGG